MVGDKITHTVDGHQYGIVTERSESEWTVAIFDEEKRRVGPLYSVTLETAAYFQQYNHQPAVDALIEIAKSDLDTGRVWREPSTDQP